MFPDPTEQLLIDGFVCCAVRNVFNVEELRVALLLQVPEVDASVSDAHDHPAEVTLVGGVVPDTLERKSGAAQPGGSEGLSVTKVTHMEVWFSV